MPVSDRRSARRLIMKVPLKFRPIQEGTDSAQSAAAMNISNHGVYFATDQKLPKGGMIQVHLKMPREVVGDEVAEWCSPAVSLMSNLWVLPTKNWASACISSIMRFLAPCYSRAADNPIAASRVHSP